MSAVAVALVVFWALMAGIAWAKACTVKKNAARDAEKAFWGGYYTALIKEGYEKGEATRKTLECRRNVES